MLMLSSFPILIWSGDIVASAPGRAPLAEKQLVRDLDVVIPEAFGAKARILMQVSYGEFLKGGDRATHARINQKRADFVVIDDDFEVLCVIEYQGAGHYGRGERARESAQYRDRVKRAACASAGIPLIEIPPRFSMQSLRDLIGPATVKVVK